MTEYDAAEQDAKMEPLSDQGVPVRTEPHMMTVKQARKQLKGMPDDSVLLICAHGFPGMDGMAWQVSHFAPVEDEGVGIVLIEGAGMPDDDKAPEPFNPDDFVEVERPEGNDKPMIQR